MASGRASVPLGIFATDLFKPTVQYDEAHQKGMWLTGTEPPTQEPVAIMEEADPPTDLVANWRTPYRDSFTNGLLSRDETETLRLHRRVKSFVVIRKDLYKTGHNGIRQLCIPIEKGNQFLEYIHGGICGHHAALRSLVGNAF